MLASVKAYFTDCFTYLLTAFFPLSHSPPYSKDPFDEFSPITFKVDRKDARSDTYYVFGWILIKIDFEHGLTSEHWTKEWNQSFLMELSHFYEPKRFHDWLFNQVQKIISTEK